MAARRATRRSNASASPKPESSALYRSIADRLNKKIGENTAVDMDGEEFVLSTVREYISTQCYGLNWAMHLDGFPVGRISCIRGDFQSGKSTIAMHLLAETQRMGGFAVYMDTEYAFDKDRAQAIGVDLSEDKWMLVQVNTVEQAVKAMRELFKVAQEEQDAGNDRLVTIVWDSVGATATEAEMTEEFGAARPGLHARLLSSALRQMTPQIAKYRIALILLNQEKEKLQFFNPGKETAKTMTAEKPIMFHSTIVLRPQHMKTLMNSNKEPTGIRCICAVRKNKLAAPFSKVEFVINFATGIDNNASILAIAYQMKIVKKSGPWYSYDGQKFYERDFGKILDAHPEIMEKLEAIRKHEATVNTAVDDDDDDDDVSEDEETDDEDEDDDE